MIVDSYVSAVSVQWAFLLYLVSSFRFVGALGWMVTRTPGWQWRVAVVLIHLTAVQSSGGLFYLVVHWGGYFLLVFAFMKRWRWQMAVAMIVGLLGLTLLQSVKPTFRASLSEAAGVRADRIDDAPVGAPVGTAQDRTDYSIPASTPTDSLVRFNQGWIIARVMRYVPVQEPYAMGSTLLDARTDSIVPAVSVSEQD